MTYLNYWHFIVLAFIVLVAYFGVRLALKQEVRKIRISMVATIVVIALISSAFSLFVVDKYTKEVKLYKLENKRLLNREQIMYTGIVKNEGSHTIGKVTFEIKIVNMSHGSVKGANFYQPSGFSDFFSGGANVLYKPQTVTHKFTVATDLRAGAAKSFRVYFDYPPYFRNVTQFAKVYGH